MFLRELNFGLSAGLLREGAPAAGLNPGRRPVSIAAVKLVEPHRRDPSPAISLG